MVIEQSEKRASLIDIAEAKMGFFGKSSWLFLDVSAWDFGVLVSGSSTCLRLVWPSTSSDGLHKCYS